MTIDDDDDTSPDDLEVELDLDELVDDAPGALEIETITPTTEAERRRDLVIPDDPTVLSYLLSGSSRSSCRAARPCSRHPRRSNGSRPWSSCSTAR